MVRWGIRWSGGAYIDLVGVAVLVGVDVAVWEESVWEEREEDEFWECKELVAG